MPNSDCVVKYEIERDEGRRPRKPMRGRLSPPFRNFIPLEIIRGPKGWAPPPPSPANLNIPGLDSISPWHINPPCPFFTRIYMWEHARLYNKINALKRCHLNYITLFKSSGDVVSSQTKEREARHSNINFCPCYLSQAVRKEESERASTNRQTEVVSA